MVADISVSDYGRHEVRRWKIGDRNGEVVAGGNGQGNRLDQLYAPCGVFVDKDHSVYVVDSGNHRVMRWCADSREGNGIVGGNGKG
ncbi:unnamed protein product [Adineta ricciae]|uniref:Uncharacterized protein n=1 Tax=Adineta ricciae TaxID=249248 RepID=A0A815J3P6_ADIRI|nr:unnamed protein product [Adineta ricciae]CAF1432348.1 unnamed protein product [Adineta ricciae]